MMKLVLPSLRFSKKGDCCCLEEVNVEQQNHLQQQIQQEPEQEQSTKNPIQEEKKKNRFFPRRPSRSFNTRTSSLSASSSSSVSSTNSCTSSHQCVPGMKSGSISNLRLRMSGSRRYSTSSTTSAKTTSGRDLEQLNPNVATTVSDTTETDLNSLADTKMQQNQQQEQPQQQLEQQQQLLEQKDNNHCHYPSYKYANVPVIVDKVNEKACMQEHPNETTELVQTSLQQFDVLLQSMVQKYENDNENLENNNNKKTYKKDKDNLMIRYYIEASKNHPQWVVHDQSFRLQFLRTEVFHIENAANRYLKYFMNYSSLYHYDNNNFYRPIQQSFMSEIDQMTLQCGYLRAIPGHARLVYADPASTPVYGKEQYDVDSIVRSIHYTCQQILQDSIMMQQKGIVSILDFETIRRFDSKLVSRISSTINEGFPVRTSMLCIINAPRGTHMFMSILKPFLNPKLRERIHIIEAITTSNAVSVNQRLYESTGITFEELFEKIQHHSDWVTYKKYKEEEIAEKKNNYKNTTMDPHQDQHQQQHHESTRTTIVQDQHSMIPSSNISVVCKSLCKGTLYTLKEI